VKASQGLLAAKSEKLGDYARGMCALLEDVGLLQSGCGELRNEDLRARLQRVAERVSFDWLRGAVEQVDEWDGLERRNVQKAAVADSFVVRLAGLARAAR